LSGIEKKRSNRRKHKVSFERPPLTGDPWQRLDLIQITRAELDTSFAVLAGRLLVIAHTDDGEISRIISARLASRGERRIYEEG
jgi:uncharacterized DUF497 family protein